MKLFLLLSTIAILYAGIVKAQSGSAWKPAMEESLLRIQSGSTEQIGFEIYNIAKTWAAAGYIAQANRLLSKFWSYNIDDLKNFRNDHAGFTVLWEVSGQRPGFIPFKTQEVNTIVQENWGDIFMQKWAPGFLSKVENKTWTELSGRLLYVKAILMSSDPTERSHPSSPIQRAEALQAFTRFLEEDPPEGYELFHSTSAAALVAASLRRTGEATTFIRAWAKGYLQYPANYSLEKLFCDTATAKILLSGILAPIWGLTNASCDSDLVRIEAILDRRINKGPSLIYGQLSLRQLLDRISDRAIKNGEDILVELVKAHWLGHTPADEAAIAETEKRLGIELPADYKSFLLTTNGFHAANNTGVSFSPVREIGWLKDKDPQLTEIWGKPMADDDTIRAEEFRRSILIGGADEEQQFLLVPPDSHHPNWQYWFFASWLPGTDPHFSIRAYLENELLEMEHKR